MLNTLKTLLIIAAPLLLHFGICWSLGILSFDSAGITALISAFVLIFIAAGLFTIIGESIIEDWVKLGMTVLLVLVASPYLPPNGLVLALGLPIGATIRPILLSLSGT